MVIGIQDAMGQAPIEPRDAVGSRGDEIGLERQWHIAGVVSVRRLTGNCQRSATDSVEEKH
jgi:hypothetical protein